MSNWVHLMGCIKIHGIKKDGIKKMYNLKNKKEYDKFFENSNNWEHFYRADEEHLQIDHRQRVVEFIKGLQKPTGSEGGIECQVCFYDQLYEDWGNDASSSETRDYNPRTGELIPFGYSLDISEEEYEKEGWRYVWFESRGENFVICVFGDLRDRGLDDFKKEFDKFLSAIDKYFRLEDVSVEAFEDWNGHLGRWSYDGFYDDYNGKINYSETHQEEQGGKNEV